MVACCEATGANPVTWRMSSFHMVSAVVMQSIILGNWTIYVDSDDNFVIDYTG